jgi:hypothetical protein
MFRNMRILLVSLAAMTLSACATATPPPASPAVVSTAPAPAAPSRIGQLLAAAGRPNAPTQADIERAMGAADITRHDGAGVALTYRLDHCALLLVFSADAQNQMRLSDAHPSARNAGEASPTVEQCAAEATARHS